MSGIPIVIPYAVGSPSGEYRVRFIDYNGTVLKTAWVNSGGSVTAPADPSHTGLTFQGWNYNASAFSNITANLDVGATYITSDGKTWLKIRLTTVTGLSPTLYLSKSSAFTLTIDWGDGNTSTNSSSGNINISHTYATAGDYTVKLYISSGSGTYSFGNGGTASVVVGGSTQNYRSALMSVNIGSNVTTINTYAFYYCRSLASITIPSGVTSIGTYAFNGCTFLTSITIPSGVTSIGDSTFNICYCLASISMPSGVTSIGAAAFVYCYSLASVTIPSGVTSIGIQVFLYCYSLTSITMPSGVTSISNSAFSSGLSLTSITIPSGVTSIGSGAFSSNYSLHSLTIPSGVTSISSNAFDGCTSILTYIIYPTSVPTLANINAFNNINSICKIYVPDASVSAYKAATNWSTYADYIYAMSTL